MDVTRIYEKTINELRKLELKYPFIRELWRVLEPKGYDDVARVEDNLLKSLKVDLIESVEEYVALEYIYRKLIDVLADEKYSDIHGMVSMALRDVGSRQEVLFGKIKDEAIKYYWVSNFGYKEHMVKDYEIVALFLIGFLLTLATKGFRY